MPILELVVRHNLSMIPGLTGIPSSGTVHKQPPLI